MTKPKVVIIVGSLRRESFNLKLAKAIMKLANNWDTQLLSFADLPVYNQDMEADFPQSAERFKKEIKAVDAVLFVTPEYNRSIPGPLKNAIDWASRPYGKNAFAQKPTAICGASPGATGTAASQHSLRPVLIYLDTILMGQPEIYFQFKDGVIDADGNVSNEDSKKFLQAFVERFTRWIESSANKTAKAA